VDVLDGFALTIVWIKRNWAGVRLRTRHWGSGYHLAELCKRQLNEFLVLFASFAVPLRLFFASFAVNSCEAAN